ncbi:hypothetical protein RUND412_010113 [Rhizina undulata]
MTSSTTPVLSPSLSYRKKRKYESDAVTLTNSKIDHKKQKNDERDVSMATEAFKTTTTTPDAPAINKEFRLFAFALSSLLSSVSSSSENDLRAALGDDKGNFLIAVKSLYSTKALPWLAEYPPGEAPAVVAGASGAQSKEGNADGEAKGAVTGKSESNVTPPKVPALPLGRPATLSLGTSTSWPPALPQVSNQALRLQAFTHKSFIKGENAGLPGCEQQHYERLEFLGDSYLQSITSHLLYNRFTSLREGSLSDMRQQLVANRSLNTYAMLYKFQDKLREGRGQENTVSGKENVSKTLADTFEAYIAAIILDDPVNGVETAKNWLAALFEPKLKDMESQHTSIAPIDKMAKQTLNNIAGGNRATIEYKWTAGQGGNKGGYWITVILTGWGFKGREIGRGWGMSKSDAALRAAMNVIADKSFCEEMARIKAQMLGPKPVVRPVAENTEVLNYDE